MKGYIYGLFNRVSKRWYVGQTTQEPETRYEQHKKLLKKGKHHSWAMQYDYWDFGSIPEIHILEEIEDKDKENLVKRLNDLETYWIIRKNARYNIDWPAEKGIQHIKYDHIGRVIPYGQENPGRKGKPMTTRWSELILIIITVLIVILVATL